MTDWLEELPGWGRKLIAESRVARLGLLDDEDRPRVLPITFALYEGRIWSAIDSKPKRSAEPARIGFLRRRPEVAITVDRYSDDWSRLAWVQLLGRAEVRDAPAEPGAMDALASRYEQYRDDRPRGPLISVEIGRGIAWRTAAPAAG